MLVTSILACWVLNDRIWSLDISTGEWLYFRPHKAWSGSKQVYTSAFLFFDNHKVSKTVESIINISLHNISAQSCVIVVIKGLEGTSVFDRTKFKPSSKTATVWKDYIIPQRYSRFIWFLVLLGKNLAKFWALQSTIALLHRLLA